MFDIVTFGGAVIDETIKANVPEKNGNILIPYGAKILIEKVHFDVGGGGTNTAVAFSRLGLKTGFIGKVGSDKNGIEILDLLKKEKVVFLGSKTKDENSGFSIILLNKNKNRSILTYKGINDEVLLRDIKDFQTKWIYFASSGGQTFKSQVELAKKLKQKGVKIVFNPSEYLLKELNVKPLLKYCDVIVLNKTEAGLLVGQKDENEMLKKIRELGPETVAITNEGQKIYCLYKNKIYSAMPTKTNIIDKTGAGDAFASGFVAGLIRNKDVSFCIGLGIKEAVAVMSHYGSRKNLIKMELR